MKTMKEMMNIYTALIKGRFVIFAMYVLAKIIASEPALDKFFEEVALEYKNERSVFDDD